MKPIESLLDLVLQILSSLEFQTFVPIGKRSVFDVVARKDDKLILIKILSNVDGLKESQAKILKNLAGELNASAIVVGLKTKAGPLLDGVVYERYGLYVVTPKTLEDALLGELPERKYWKGKFISRVDTTSLSNLINESDINEIAKILGVTRESVYLYKTGKINIEFSKAEKLRSKFNLPLEKYNILAPPTPEKLPLNGYLKDLERLGFDVVPVHKSFDAIAKERESLLVARKECQRTPDLEYLKKAGEFLHSYPMLVSTTQEKCVRGVPVVRVDEIKEARKAKDILKLVKERKEKE